MDEKILEIEDLVVEYKTERAVVHALNGVTLTLNKGESLGLVGESGAGKTTTALSILNLLPESSASVKHGDIRYHGKSVFQMNSRELQAMRGGKISMIFQNPLTALNPVFTVGEQIAMVLRVHRGMSRRAASERAKELLEMVGIAGYRIKDYPNQFSGGMRQRVGIAAGLACNPELLIADEPTTALDVTIQAKILDEIKEIKRKQKLSVIFITHDLGVVANMADRICVMYAGKIVEVGTAREIFYSPAHPYTWALLSSMPDLETKERLFSIPGTPPNMIFPPKGDAFAERNQYAMQVDFEEEPPFFKLSDTHYAATWLLHPNAPKVEMPEALQHRIARMNRKEGV